MYDTATFTNSDFLQVITIFVDYNNYSCKILESAKINTL